MKVVNMKSLANIEEERKEAIELINSSDGFVVGYRDYKKDVYGWTLGNLKQSDMLVLGNLITFHAVHEMDKEL